MARASFREHILRVREDAIVVAVNNLLAEKGFDLMTVDEVASEVGIAKASLYKHFPSKEALAAAAMVRILRLGCDLVQSLATKAEVPPMDRLKAVARWALQTQLANQMPILPSQNSTLRAELMANRDYIDLLMQVSDELGSWIVAAQASGAINPQLPPEVVLYTVYSRACDPVPGFLKAGGQYNDEQIVDWVLSTCFDGLARRA